MPYWASINSEKVNMRVGPSQTYRIDWVYQRPDLPLKVLRIKDGWRLVEDPDGAQGWMVARLLRRARTAIVTGDDLAEIRAEPSARAILRWKAEPGVIGKLGRCENAWCHLDIAGREGWIRKQRIWGAGAP